MSPMTQFILDFSGIFIIVAVIYLAFINRNKMDVHNLKDNDEIRVILTKYDINPVRIKYKQFVVILSLCNAFIIAFASALIITIDKFGWALLVSIVVIMALTYSMMEIVGRYYRKQDEKYEGPEPHTVVEVVEEKHYRRKTKKKKEKKKDE